MSVLIVAWSYPGSRERPCLDDPSRRQTYNGSTLKRLLFRDANYLR